MPSSAPTRIFISYAHRDGADLARRLQVDLRQNGFDTWLDTGRLTVGDVWSREIEKAIDEAEVVVALLSSGSFESDICRAEQSRALGKGKCILPVRVQDDCDIPLELQTRQYLDFSNLRLHDEQLSKLITAIRKRDGFVAPAGSLIRYNNAPALPQSFVDRPELLERLRDTLFTPGANRNIAITAMQGMGGIGKTVLAEALCHDEVVQQAFPDGIFWFSIGKESRLNFCALMKSVPALDRLLGTYEGEAACVNQYRDVLRKKAALIVVDDVWRTSDFQPFVAESTRSRLLITTRDTSIGAWFGAREFTANLLTEDESRQVLSNWSGLPVDQLPRLATELIHECGSLPLALAMIGAQLRGRPPILWKAKLDDLRNADLESIKAQFPEPHTTLFRAIEISVDALDDKMRDRYLALAVLLEDMSIRPEFQQCLWGVNEVEAAEVAEHLISLSLVQRDKPEGGIHPHDLPILQANWNVKEAEARRLNRQFVDRSLARHDGTDESIRLHDLQLDYVRSQYPDRKALDLIHGAVRLSTNVISRDPAQFASQVVGRLLPHQGVPAIKQFLTGIIEGAPKPWLRPLQSALHPPGTALMRTLEGDARFVNGVAVTADGKRAVSASGDNTLKVWDLETGRVLRTLEGHSEVRVVAVSADGRRAVSVSYNTLKVWDLETGRELRTLEGDARFINGVAVTADGNRAVSASADNTLTVWDLESGRELRALEGHSDRVRVVAVSADGRRAISASGVRTLTVWDVETGRLLRTLEGYSSYVLGVAVSADGRRAVSASYKTLKVWDVETGRELRTLEGHSGRVRGVAVSADGQRAVSASEDETLKVWDVETGRELRTLEGHSGTVQGVAVSADGRRAVSASVDRTFKVWDVETGRDLRTLERHSSTVQGVAVSADGRRAVSASLDRTLKVWDLETGRALRTLEGHSDAVTGVAVSADGRRAVSASLDRTLKVWDVETGRELRTLEGHSGAVTGVSVSADGRRAVSASLDRTLRVWDVETGRALRTLEGHSSFVQHVAVSADGQRAVSASDDRTLKVWDVEKGHALRTLEGHSGYVRGVAVSADGRRAVSASVDQTLKVWDVETGRALRTLEGHSGYVRGVAVSADGRRAVSASVDQTLKVWDLETGRPVATFYCEESGECCAFAGNQKIVAGDAGGRLHFLKLEELP